MGISNGGSSQAGGRRPSSVAAEAVTIFALVAVVAVGTALALQNLNPAQTASPLPTAASPTTGPMVTPPRTDAASPPPTDTPNPTPIASPGPTASPTLSKTSATLDPNTYLGIVGPVGSRPKAQSRVFYAAASLPGGSVLLAGGLGSGEDGAPAGPLRSAEVYDASKNAFKATGSMNAGRFYFTATPLDDGRVLMAGGADMSDFMSLSSAELYDPGSGKFTPTGSMAMGRAKQTATLLADGRVLIAGGHGGGAYPQMPVAECEIYNPATGSFTPTGHMHVPREDATATLLPGGKVLIAGGTTYSTRDGSPLPTASAEMFDPATGTWTTTGSMATARTSQAAIALHDGKVYVVGGADAKGDALASVEVFQPLDGTFTTSFPMTTPRVHPTVTQVSPFGRFVVAGGDRAKDHSSLDFYVPDSAAAGPSGSSSLALGINDVATANFTPNGLLLLNPAATEWTSWVYAFTTPKM